MRLATDCVSPALFGTEKVAGDGQTEQRGHERMGNVQPIKLVRSNEPAERANTLLLLQVDVPEGQKAFGF